MFNKISFKVIAFAIPFILVFAATGINLVNVNGEFVFDDETYFIYNDVITTISPFDFSALFNSATNLWGEALPLRDFLYVLQFKAFGKDTTGYHMVCMLLFICSYLVSFLLLFNIVQDYLTEKHELTATSVKQNAWLITVVITSFFLFHPINVESFSYISGQKDALSYLFIVASIYCIYRAGREKEKLVVCFILGIIFHYFAVLSKLSALSSVLFIPVLLLVLSNYSLKKKYLLIGLWLLANIPVILWFSHAMSITENTQVTQISSIALLERIPRSFNYIGHQLSHLLKPWPLSMGYPVSVHWIMDRYFMLGVMFSFGALFISWLTKNRLLFVGFSIFILYLAPTLHIYLDICNEKVYDRYLTVPFIGVLFMLIPVFTFFLLKSRFWKKNTLLFCFFLVSMLGFFKYRYLPVFKTEKFALEYAYRYFPKKNNIVVNLALYYADAGDWKKVFAIVEKDTGKSTNLHIFRGMFFFMHNDANAAIREYEQLPQSAEMRINIVYRIAHSYDKTGNIKKALEYYDKTIKSKEIDWHGFKGKAKKRVSQLQNKSAAQVTSLQEAVQSNPLDFNAYIQLGRVQEELLLYAEAIHTYEELLKQGGAHWALYYNLGNACKKNMNYQKAADYYKKSSLLNNNNPDTYNNLGLVLKELKDHEGAINAFKTAIKINPRFKEAPFNLAILYFKLNDKENALKYFNGVLKSFPELKNEVTPYIEDLYE